MKKKCLKCVYGIGDWCGQIEAEQEEIETETCEFYKEYKCKNCIHYQREEQKCTNDGEKTDENEYCNRFKVW